MEKHLQSPILFLIFNRPQLTAIVFEEIRKQKPQQLFIAADGPRKNKKGEDELCLLTRKIILENINWECDVHTLFRDENLGCGKAVSSAINWFFDNVEEGIILEDDCLPNETFFSFCEEMLHYYRDNDQVMHIGATNYQQGIVRGDGSYYLSRLAHIWGWATWKSAWEKYDFTLERYKNLSKEGLGYTQNRYFDSVYNKEIDTWDVQWFMSVWFNNGICIIPNTSLIENIGYESGATHTSKKPRWLRMMTVGSMPSIVHPSFFEVCVEADKYTLNKVFNDNFMKKIFFYFKRKIINANEK